MKLASNTSASFLSGATDEDEIDFTDHSAPYLSGHSFALRCHRWYSPKMRRLGVNPTVDNDCIFVRADDLNSFAESGLVPDRFVLVSHNSDFEIGTGHLPIINDTRVKLWLTMNKGIDHPKVVALPDGLQNSVYSYGNPRLLSAIVESLGAGPGEVPYYKTERFYANYTIDSRFKERARCAAVCQPQGISLHGRAHVVDYLAGIASALFTLCPAGSGIDSCRPYEAIYLKSIPIVTHSVHAHELSRDHGMPMVIVKDWIATDFNASDFDLQFYQNRWNVYAPSEMYMDALCARIKKKHGVNL